MRKVQASIDALNTRSAIYVHQSMLDDEMYKMQNMTGLNLSPDQISKRCSTNPSKNISLSKVPENLCGHGDEIQR